MSATRTRAQPSARSRPHAVSRPHDPAEQQADRAADVVARGGSVTGWSFASVAESAGVHRDGDGSTKADEDKKKPEAQAEKPAETSKVALESPAGEKVQKSILDEPAVKKAIEFASSPTGIGLGVGLGAAGVTALAANHKPLPFQPPAIPLDKIGLKGFAAKIEYQGPVDRPTGVGLSLRYTEQGPAKKKGPTETEKIRAEKQRLQADLDQFRAGLRPAPGTQAARDQQAADEASQQAVADYVARHSSLPGVGRPLVPAAGGSVTITAPPASSDVEKAEPEPKKQDDAPVQREPASTTDHAPVETSRVDAAVRGSGRALDPSVRRSMEARFGYDFSQVRLHDDAMANAAAHDARAAAFTIGADIVLGAGRLDTRTPAGRRLLAHELAHVVQQSGRAGPVLQRRNVFESIGIWLGLTEGTWSDRELHAYLDAVTTADAIDGSYDADNKARAIVRRWKDGSAGYDLLGKQKALLIAEMLDGPTLGDDEVAILDLLELSDASDLRAIFMSTHVTLDRLESDINGDNRTRLDAVVSSRFSGGRDAVRNGQLRVIGPAVPAGAPVRPFDAATLDAWVSSDRTSDELIALLDHMAASERTAALHHLSQVRRPKMLATLHGFEKDVRDETDEIRKLGSQALVTAQREFMLKVERVLLHFFHSAIPATKAELESGTSATDPARRTELQDALTPPASAPGAKFRDQIPGEPKTYGAKLRGELPGMVSTVLGKIRKKPPRTHTLGEFEALANVSKDETDKVFGTFYDAGAHPAFVADAPKRKGNLHDAFESTKGAQDRMKPKQRTASALNMLRYLITTRSQILALNRHHDARPKFDPDGKPLNDEATIQDTAARAFIKADKDAVANLLEIDRGWDASAGGGHVFVQLYQPTDAAADRLLLWDMFQTLIHEYLHTLVAKPYSTYADSFGDGSAAENTLSEGVDSLLDEIVWENVEPRVKTTQLRTKVEGPTIAAKPPIEVPHPSQRRYPSYTQALKLVDLVGIENLYAAYFLGLVDRIGGPASAPAGAKP